MSELLKQRAVEYQIDAFRYFVAKLFEGHGSRLVYGYLIFRESLHTDRVTAHGYGDDTLSIVHARLCHRTQS